MINLLKSIFRNSWQVNTRIKITLTPIPIKPTISDTMPCIHHPWELSTSDWYSDQSHFPQNSFWNVELSLGFIGAYIIFFCDCQSVSRFILNYLLPKTKVWGLLMPLIKHVNAFKNPSIMLHIYIDTTRFFHTFYYHLYTFTVFYMPYIITAITIKSNALVYAKSMAYHLCHILSLAY